MHIFPPSIEQPFETEQQTNEGHSAVRELLTDRRTLLGLGVLTVAAELLTACDGSPEAAAPSVVEPTAPASTGGNVSSSPGGSPSPNVLSSPESRYPEHKNIVASVFWVGEPADKDDAGIDNISTAWEDDARKTFGGIDNPKKRQADGSPTDFVPEENDCYVALPMDEYSDKLIKGAREASYWANEARNLPSDDSESLFKGRWVKVTSNGKTVYGQWLDCGPSNNGDVVDDPKYVFGNARPKNNFDLKAGIDLSPAMAYLLDFGRGDLSEVSGTVSWSFMDEKDVPDGRWKKYKAIDNKTRWS